VTSIELTLCINVKQESEACWIQKVMAGENTNRGVLGAGGYM
jgi:hypothetical protein